MVRSKRSRGRGVFLCTFVTVIIGQTLLALVIQEWRPDWKDAEYGTRLRQLQHRIAEAPERPLVLLLGSSRVGNGIASDLLSGGKADGEIAPLVFNMSLVGSGPFMELLCVRRLLAHGIRPRAVIIEVFPPLLLTDGLNIQTSDYLAGRLDWSDLAAFRQFAPNVAITHYLDWFGCNCAPWFTSRCALMNNFAPSWLKAEQLQQARYWPRLISPFGWIPYGLSSVTPEQYQSGLQVAKNGYYSCLGFTAVNKTTDEVLHELLDLCLSERIQIAALVMMPESSEFRSWYHPATEEVMVAYLTKLSCEYHTQLVNAREWLPDSCFADGHHLLPEGALRFTDRFWKVVSYPSSKIRSW